MDVGICGEPANELDRVQGRVDAAGARGEVAMGQECVDRLAEGADRMRSQKRGGICAAPVQGSGARAVSGRAGQRAPAH